MAKHADDDPVMVGFSSGRNVSMQSHQPEELGYKWGQWRSMTEAERHEAMNEYVHKLVDAWVEDNEEGVDW
jgi:hypothetical protein